MKMKDVCEKTGISKRNIHFYIQEGLLEPESDVKNHYYTFSQEDCDRLLFIRQVRNAGLSIPAIRSILDNPFTASFYINQHIKKLRKQQRYLEQTLISLQYILDGLPFYPDLASIKYLTASAGIPVPENEEDASDAFAPFDPYSTSIINRFLWGGFLPAGKLTEYQEFLWMKINRLTAENPSPEYKKLAKTLYSMSSGQISEFFATNVERYHIIAALTDATLPAYANDMIRRLQLIVKNPHLISLWKNMYDGFFYPTTIIQASELSPLVMELSPLYKSYVQNIIRLCDRVYSYLLSAEGSELYRDLAAAFGDFINLADFNHGQLEAIYSLPDLHSLQA